MQRLLLVYRTTLSLQSRYHLPREPFLQRLALPRQARLQQPLNRIPRAFALADGDGPEDGLGGVPVRHEAARGGGGEDGLAEDGQWRSAREGVYVEQRARDDAVRFLAVAVPHDARRDVVQERVFRGRDVQGRGRVGWTWANDGYWRRWRGSLRDAPECVLVAKVELSDGAEDVLHDRVVGHSADGRDGECPSESGSKYGKHLDRIVSFDTHNISRQRTVE